MKALLLYKDRDFDLNQPLPWNEAALTQDLELDILFNAMADDDKFLSEVARKAVFSGINSDPGTMRYRQDILKDCLSNPSIIRAVYDISVAAVESRKNSWFGIFISRPSSILFNSIGMMRVYVDKLKELRRTAGEHADKFVAEGFTRFFEMLKRELGDEYFLRIEDHLDELEFSDGILISAQLGNGNKGVDYTLRKLQVKKRSWLQRLFPKKPPGYFFYVHPRDESGVRALSALNDEGINRVANVLAQSNDHILSFFKGLRTELAFYTGCLNLHEKLTQLGEPCSFPLLIAASERKYSFKGLYDACLALSMKQKITGNDLDAGDKNLVIITGANRGGKSTSLRSIGLSQMMMQCGMFVPAESFCANSCSNLFTHFKREEDNTMKSGKLDEELGRMSDITDHITPDSMLLFNESFAATNEREGSEIARQVVSALLEKHLKVFFVTHLYDFAHSLYDERGEDVIFLRAERQTDTRRTFKLTAGEPLPTSYGIDLYNKIFGNS